MNFVLKEKRENGGYFIVSVIKDDRKFLVRSKRVDAHGNVLVWNNVSGNGFDTARFDTLEEAKERAKTIASTKRRRQGMQDIKEDTLPDFVKTKLAAPIESQVDVTQLLEFVKQARRERYVVFADVTGMEDLFDLGVEYVGNITDDPAMLDVFDKFGVSRGIMVERLARVNKTEQCIEAEGVKA